MLHKSNIAVICILGMVVGFLVSRVALSISMFLFGMNAIRDISPRQWLRNKWWLLGVGWVAIYALTWFWSEDKGNWGTRLEVKLPFLILPLAFSFLPRFSDSQKRILTISIALLLVTSACYSVSFLILEPAYYVHEYKQAHVLPTLPKYDHIRFSLAIALFIIFSISCWPSLVLRSAKILVGCSLAFLVVYIHILAAKSGLLSFYIFLIGWGIYLAFARKIWIGLLVILAIPLFIAFALKYMPTFREKEHYLDFTYYMFRHGDKSGSLSDLGRLNSYVVAFDLIKQHPMIGVGTGDMKGEMEQGYARLYPETQKENMLIPHNQFLVVALGCGIPAMLLFTVWVFMPLARLRKDRQSFFLFMVWFLLFLQLMIEPVLEIQLGVFVYTFFLMMQMHEQENPQTRHGGA